MPRQPFLVSPLCSVLPMWLTSTVGSLGGLHGGQPHCALEACLGARLDVVLGMGCSGDTGGRGQFGPGGLGGFPTLLSLSTWVLLPLPLRREVGLCPHSPLSTARGGAEAPSPGPISPMTSPGPHAITPSRDVTPTSRHSPPEPPKSAPPLPETPLTKMAAAATGGAGPASSSRPLPAGRKRGRGAAMPGAAGLLLPLLLLLPGLAALEPLSVGLAIGVASALTGYLSHPNFYCSYVECCPSAGHRLNATGTGVGTRGRGRGVAGSPQSRALRVASPRSAAGAAGRAAVRAAPGQGGGVAGSDGFQPQPQPQEAADAVAARLGRHGEEFPQPAAGPPRPPRRAAQQVRAPLPGHPALPAPAAAAALPGEHGRGTKFWERGQRTGQSGCPTAVLPAGATCCWLRGRGACCEKLSRELEPFVTLCFGVVAGAASGLFFFLPSSIVGWEGVGERLGGGCRWESWPGVTKECFAPCRALRTTALGHKEV